jgi:hypothetical protein
MKIEKRCRVCDQILKKDEIILSRIGDIDWWEDPENNYPKPELPYYTVLENDDIYVHLCGRCGFGIVADMAVDEGAIASKKLKTQAEDIIGEMGLKAFRLWGEVHILEELESYGGMEAIELALNGIPKIEIKISIGDHVKAKPEINWDID